MKKIKFLLVLHLAVTSLLIFLTTLMLLYSYAEFNCFEFTNALLTGETEKYLIKVLYRNIDYIYIALIYLIFSFLSLIIIGYYSKNYFSKR